MTPSDDNQPDNSQNNQEFDQTVKLMRCEKHGISFLVNEGCPECAREKDPSSKDSTG